MQDYYTPEQRRIQKFESVQQAILELRVYNKTPGLTPKALIDQIVQFIAPGYITIGLHSGGMEGFIIHAKNLSGKDVCFKLAVPAPDGIEGKRTVLHFWDYIKGRTGCEVRTEDVRKKRFIRGAEIQKQIYLYCMTHNIDFFNVPAVYVTREDPLYIEMEWINSVSCLDWFKEKPSLHGALTTFCNLLRAIRFVHGKNIIHRDLKPSNILIGAYNSVYILDWTLAKEIGDANTTAIGSWIGSAPYASFEQASNARDADFLADIHALGYILYAFVIGKDLPLPTSKPDIPYLTRLYFYREQVLSDPLFPKIFHDVFQIATHPQKEKRYQDVDSFLDAVKDIIKKNTVPERENVVLPIPPLQPPRNKLSPQAQQALEKDIATQADIPMPKPEEVNKLDEEIFVREESEKYYKGCMLKNGFKNCTMAGETDCKFCLNFYKTLVRFCYRITKKIKE